jgi:uncharacterized BrkB/YihY/UPF0761 family membrane protein
MLEDHQPEGPGVPQSPVEPGADLAPVDADAVAAAVGSPDRDSGRIRRFVDHRRRWLTSEQVRLQEDLQARRQRSGMVDTGFLVQELDANVGGGILAGALAFRLFLFMVPFVYVVFTVLGGLARAMGKDPAQVSGSIGITGILANAVVKIDEQSAWTQAALVLGAIVTLFITSGALMKALYVVHWLIWRVPRIMPTGLAPRLGLIGFALVASALSVAVNELRTSAGIAGSLLSVLIITALSFALWWWVSWKLPHASGPARALIPGALLMAVGADVLDLLTAYWIGNLVARKTNTYGAVGIAIAVLLWVYILGRIMVGSAGLNAALWYRRQNRPDLGQTAERQRP